MYFRVLLLFSILMSPVVKSQAGGLCQEIFTDLAKELRDFPGELSFNGKFLKPNEKKPYDLAKVLKNAKPGVLISVGSERVLADALMIESKLSLVLALDADPAIVRFHRLNALLFKIAPEGDFKVYSRMRKSPLGKLWQERAIQAHKQGLITPAEHRMLLDSEMRQWWQKNLVGLGWNKFYNSKIAALTGRDPIRYMQNKESFLKLQKYALDNKYQSYRVDFSDRYQIRNLLQHLKNQGLRVSVFDLSNAWQGTRNNSYLGERGVERLFSSLEPVFDNSTLFVGTFGYRMFGFFYRAYSLSHLKKHATGFWPSMFYQWLHWDYETMINDLPGMMNPRRVEFDHVVVEQP